MTSAPLVGQIACGQLSFAVEDIEGTYMLPRDIFGNGELFLLRAFGNSMIEIGIEEGDLLVLKKTELCRGRRHRGCSCWRRYNPETILQKGKEDCPASGERRDA